MSSPKVSHSDLEEAFLLASYDRHCWLDKQTARVLSYGSERERWFEYENVRRHEYIQEWAGDEGVEIDFSGDVS